MNLSLPSLVAAVIGGALIGASASAMLLLVGRIAGISGIIAGVLRPRPGDLGWRAAFLGGLLAGGLVLALAAPETVSATSPASLGSVLVAGLLVGVGTQLGNGCTSGHGVCGISRFAPRSLAATATFMVTGALSALAARRFFEGG